MNDPQVTIALTGRRRAFQPGELLTVEYRVMPITDQAVRSVEASVLWYTEGKGDEDLAVHFFDALDSASIPAGAPILRRFSTRLPPSPLSYNGVILKIRWCVRIRIFQARGRESMVEHPFVLGNLPFSSEPRGALTEPSATPT